MTTTSDRTPDRIEKQIELRASPERVWRALTSAREFGAWFGCEISSDFAPGTTVHGRITTKGYEGLAMELQIERMDRERLFSFRWHPYAIDPEVDYSREPTTLVELRLEPAAAGTRLVVSESGFDRIPADRRPRAFEMNAGGWEAQLRNIERYLGTSGAAEHVA